MLSELEKALKRIEVLRQNLYDIVRCKGSASDPEVIRASQRLDRALCKYYRLLKIKTGYCISENKAL
jgi:hypothetical protein